MKEKIGRLLYKTVGHILPGEVGKKFRAYTACMMFTEVGTNLNFEKYVNTTCNLKIGNNSGIGEGAYIQGETYIGNYVMMAKNVRIFTRNHKFSRLDIPMCKQGTQDEKPVYIGDDVWIGDSAMILPGSQIGKGVIVGGGAVVRGNIPDYAIVIGNPAQIIGYREERKK